ncbi:DUF261 family protein [Borrelia miyamotoi]|uniref:DUF261 family protein n=1 Tax=Borrelia miyamotoi TaxID=47466 RepID=UPI003D6B750E
MQHDHKLISHIQQWDVIFLCFHYYIERFNKLSFNINGNYNKFVNLRYMKNNYFYFKPIQNI